MKKVLSIILAIVMIASCMPVAFAAEMDFNDFYWTVNKFDLYRYNIYYPIEETIEGYEEYVFTDIGELMDAKLEIALQEYPSYRMSDSYFQEHPDHLEPINAIFESIIDEVNQKIASGEYNMIADLASFIIELTELERQVNEDVIEFTALYDILPESTMEIFETKFNIFSDMYEACCEDYTAYTYEETNTAAEDAIAFFGEVVECVLGDHKQIAYKDNGNGTHRMVCLFCGFESEEETEHSLAFYTSTDFGLTVNKCEFCDEIEAVVDEDVLSQADRDMFVREFSAFLGYQVSVYDNTDDVYYLMEDMEKGALAFEEMVTAAYGSVDGFNADSSKEWIDKNAEKLPVAVLVFGYAHAMMNKAAEEGKRILKVNAFELVHAVYKVNSKHSVSEFEAFGINNSDITDGISDAMDIITDKLYEGDFADQQEFDEFVAPVIEIYNKIGNCMAGEHIAGYVDNGDGTHKLDCTFCSYVSDPEAHTWGEYVPNGDATAEADGTKTAKCLYCEATDTVTDEGSKLPTDDPTDEPTDKPSEEEETVNLIKSVIDVLKDFFRLLTDFLKHFFA